MDRPEIVLSDPEIWSSLNHLLRWRARHQEDSLAYTFLREGESSTQNVTYGELGRRARVLAHSLHQKNLSGERVLLVYPPGLDFLTAFFGCLLAGVIAVPIPAPAPHRWHRHLNQIRAICTDAAPRAILTTGAIRDSRPPDVREFSDLTWLTLDPTADDLDSTEDWMMPTVDSVTLAYLQYTSGSTSAPKGVMVSHGNVLDNCYALNDSCEITSESRFVTWLPHFHDMGLVYGLILPMHQGISSYMMSPTAFVQRPARWLQAISDLKATHSASPNFGYDICVDRTTPEERKLWDLSRWAVALNGAEPVQPKTLQRFSEAFAASGFRPATFCPGYGLAEATLKVTLAKKHNPVQLCTVDATELEQHRIQEVLLDSLNAKTLVGCGRPTSDMDIAIVDPVSGNRCSPKRVGEIWVSSSSNALGYWQRSLETQQTFQAHLADTPDKLYLRTGDLGFLKDRELYVTGRLKDLIIIRGANYYPQDFELAMKASHPALHQTSGIAFSVTVGDEERLVLVQEISRHDRHIDLAPIYTAIRTAISQDFSLPVQTIVLVTAGSLPKTSSGKSQRRLCREMFLSGTLDIFDVSTLSDLTSSDRAEPLSREILSRIAPDQRQAHLESHLCHLVAICIHAEPTEISPKSRVNALGLDSMRAAQMANGLQGSLGITLSLSLFLGEQTLSEIAAAILNQLADHERLSEEQDIPKVPTDALSFGEQALWSIHQRASTSTAYHITAAFRIQPQLQMDALQNALQAVSERHPSLRSCFPMQQGGPKRKILAIATSSLYWIDADGWDDLRIGHYLQEAASAPFDLATGPLFRVHLLQIGCQESILLFSMHHIISDFWSVTVLLRDVFQRYQKELQGQGNTLPVLPAQYQDYVQWQRQMVIGAPGERDARFWETQLGGRLPTLDLPSDHPRPVAPTYLGANHPFRIGRKTTETLKSLSRTQGATPFMTLLAGYLTLLSRYTGQDDLLVGIPTSGRDRLEWSGMIGYFVNPVVIRADTSGDLSFVELLEQVRQTVLQALKHSAYPFPLLVGRLQPKRDPGRLPLFQTMFVWQSTAIEDIPSALALGADDVSFKLGDLTLESIALKGDSTQFDLTLTMGEMGDQFGASLKYSTALFDPVTISRMSEHFILLLEHVAQQPDIRISEITLSKERVAAS